MVEVELKDDGNVIVRELVDDERRNDQTWMEFSGSLPLPLSIAEIVKNNLGSSRKHRYRLDTVISFVRGDRHGDATESSDEANGHHVLHCRLPAGYKREAFENQRDEAERVASDVEAEQDALAVALLKPKLTLTSSTKPKVFRNRIEDVNKRLESLDESNSEWVLFLLKLPWTSTSVLTMSCRQT
jgi:hypothetical protein